MNESSKIQSEVSSDPKVNNSPNGNNLSFDEKILVAAKLLGYKKLPPSIEQFVNDPYYLGNTFGNEGLYPFWMEKLKEIYPTPIHTKYPYLVLSGAIGSGKSTVSKICALYNKCRLDHMENHKYFGLAKTKAIDFVFSHISSEKAHNDFVLSIAMITHDAETGSPYFKEGMISKHAYRSVIDGARTNSGIGGDVIFYVLSEVNFFRYDKAKEKIETAFKRFKSRYQKALGYVGNIIIDSSSAGDASVVEDFIKTNHHEGTLVVKATIWDAKKHLNMYFRKKKDGTYFDEPFKVYCGDSVTPPFIVDNNSDIVDTMDLERIILVPGELKSDFRSDIYKALADMAGVSTSSSGKYLNDPQKFVDCLVLNQSYKDIEIVDFYDKEDRMIYKIQDEIDSIPSDKIIFIRADIGISNDLMGIAISYFDKYIPYSVHDRVPVMLPTYKTPVAIAFSRKAGQQTPILHLQQLVLDLHERFEIGEFTADSFASEQLIQDLRRNGVNANLLSVDRKDSAYNYFKNCVNNGLWKGPRNDLLLFEVTNLLHIDGKVDHKQGVGKYSGSVKIAGQFSEPNRTATYSKDTCDGVSGSIFSMYRNLDLAIQLSTKYKATYQSDLFKMRGNSSNDDITNLFNGMMS